MACIPGTTMLEWQGYKDENQIGKEKSRKSHNFFYVPLKTWKKKKKKKSFTFPFPFEVRFRLFVFPFLVIFAFRLSIFNLDQTGRLGQRTGDVAFSLVWFLDHLTIPALSHKFHACFFVAKKKKKTNVFILYI